jgi:hypothetical protein
MSSFKDPLTNAEIRKLKCQRCGKKAIHQWSLCCLDGRYVPVCLECDILLNLIIADFLNLPDAKEVVADYANQTRIRNKEYDESYPEGG